MAGEDVTPFQHLRSRPLVTLSCLLALLRARFALRSCQRGRRVYAFGRVLVENRGTIRLADRSYFVAGILPAELRCGPGALIEVGEDSGLGHGVSIEAHGEVRIGRHTMLASQVRICDLGRDGVAPVIIGDDVWLAHGVIVEPGVTIGNGSVVSAGSVVTRDVPAGHLAGGNPARSVRLSLAIPGLRQEPVGTPAGGPLRGVV
jgi:maltose O-acetyltransferase